MRILYQGLRYKVFARFQAPAVLAYPGKALKDQVKKA